MSDFENTETNDQPPKPGELVENGNWRLESDSLGLVRVPADRLWGAQTQRSLIHVMTACRRRSITPIDT